MRIACALAALLAALSLPAASALRTIPAEPRAGQEFLIVVDTQTPWSPAFQVDATTTVLEGVLSAKQRIGDGGIPASSTISTALPVLAANPGTYTVNVVTQYLSPEASFRIGTPPQSAGSVTVAAAAAAAPQFTGLDGLWYRADQPGWGMTLAQGSSGRLFAVWYTYESGSQEAAGPTTAAWFAMTGGAWVSATEYRGILYAAHGTPAGKPFNPLTQFLTPVGVMTLQFDSAQAVRLSVEGVQPSPYATPVALTKFRF